MAETDGGAVNGEARKGLAVLEQRMAGCREACAAHRDQITERIRTLGEQRDSRIGSLEEACERMGGRVQALEVDVQVRSARLDAGSKIFVAAMALIGTVVSALIAHFAK